MIPARFHCTSEMTWTHTHTYRKQLCCRGEHRHQLLTSCPTRVAHSRKPPSKVPPISQKHSNLPHLIDIRLDFATSNLLLCGKYSAWPAHLTDHELYSQTGSMFPIHTSQSDSIRETEAYFTSGNATTPYLVGAHWSNSWCLSIPSIIRKHTSLIRFDRGSSFPINATTSWVKFFKWRHSYIWLKALKHPIRHQKCCTG